MTPEETRITSLTAEPYPDGYRLRVNVEMTPYDLTKGRITYRFK